MLAFIWVEMNAVAPHLKCLLNQESSARVI